MATIQLAQLLEAGVHFGHKLKDGTQKCFHTFMLDSGIHILDLVQSAQLLKEANSLKG